MSFETFLELHHRVSSVLARDMSMEEALSAISDEVRRGLLDGLISDHDLYGWIVEVEAAVNHSRGSPHDAQSHIACLAFALQQQVARLLSSSRESAALITRGNALWCLGHALYPIQAGLAADYFGDASALRRRTGHELEAALCSMNQAMCLDSLDRFNEALSLFRQAEPVLENHRRAGSYANCVSGQANCLLRLSRHQEALALCERSERVLATLGGQQECARFQVTYGVCLYESGRIERALPLFEQALPVLQEYGLLNEWAHCLVTYAACFQDLGRDQDALVLFPQAEDVLRKSGSSGTLVSCLINHASCLRRLRRFDEALSIYEEAEVTLQGSGSRRDIAICLVSHANCLDDAGRCAEALPRYERAGRILQETRASFDLANCLMNHAVCLKRLGRLAEASLLYERAVSSADEMGEPAAELKWRSRYNLALLLLTPGREDPVRAESLLTESIAIVEQRVAASPRVEDRIGMRQTQADLFRIAVRVDLLLGKPIAAFNHAQQAKGRSLLDIAANTPPHRGHEETLLRLLAEEFAIVAQAHKLPESGAGDRDVILEGIRREIREIGERLREERPDRALLRLGAVRKIADIQTVLQSGEVLIDALDIGGEVVLFLVTSLGLLKWHRVEWEVFNSIGERTNAQWSSSLEVLALEGLVQEVDTFAELYELLLAPFQEALAGAERLIISPSGGLHQIPFSALWYVGSDNEIHYLCQDYELATIPMATSLWLLRTQRQLPAGPVSLLAAAPFATEELPSDPRRPRSAPQDVVLRDGDVDLPYTGWEVQEVGALVEEARQVLVGAEAQLAVVERWAPVVQLVLLATHGTYLQNEVGLLDYALLFAREEEGYPTLSMRQLFGGDLSLQHAVSVALTACHLGQVVLHGEEAMGFQQAFLSAGAVVSLAPLWAVDDAATAVLSVEYHRALIEEGVSAARAMQLAMEKVRSTPGWEHPFFWAAMLPSGDGASFLQRG